MAWEEPLHQAVGAARTLVAGGDARDAYTRAVATLRTLLHEEEKVSEEEGRRGDDQVEDEEEKETVETLQRRRDALVHEVQAKNAVLKRLIDRTRRLLFHINVLLASEPSMG